MYAVDKRIPLPGDSGIRGRTKYPFAMMEIGDSFFVPRVNVKRNTIDSAKRKAQLNLGRKFTLRTYPDGVRIWRVA